MGEDEGGDDRPQYRPHSKYCQEFKVTSKYTHTHTVDREELSVMVLVQVDICRFDLNHHFYMLEDCTVIHNRNTDYPLLNLFNINPQ